MSQDTEEMFPPTEAELQEIISKLEAELDACQDNDELDRLIVELQKKKNQLHQLTVKNEAL